MTWALIILNVYAYRRYVTANRVSYQEAEA